MEPDTAVKDETRLVPMTRKQRDWLVLLLPGMSMNQDIPQGMIDAWDAAPAGDKKPGQP